MTMQSSKFASFAHYTPPPDDAARPSTTKSSASNKKNVRPWFSTQSTPTNDAVSYQSGGIPSFNTSFAGGPGAISDDLESQQSMWETRNGMRVDILATVAYLFGPISALILLIRETQNDFVRFHAYQCAIIYTPLYFIRMLLSVLQFPSWFKTFTTLLIIVSQMYFAFRAYRDASVSQLSRHRIPFVGDVAERWLAEE